MNNLIFNVPLITSKSNETISFISKLANKKHRILNKLFVCDGIKLFEEAFLFGAKIKFIVIDNSAELSENTKNIVRKCLEKGSKLLCVEKHVFEKVTTEIAPQGLICVCEFLDNKHVFCKSIDKKDLVKSKIFVLESIRDPGNMGTILRNAVALGIDMLILSKDCADIYSPKVIRASMGALFKIDLRIVDDLLMSIETVKSSGRRVLAAALDDKALVLGKDVLLSDDVIILGNEGHGMSLETISICSNVIFIPMKGNTESLNVAMASAILMWEISK